LTTLLSCKRHRTLDQRFSIEQSRILKSGHVGDVIAVAVVDAAGDLLAAAGDGRQNS
jgi:hypothetical protein